MFVVHSLSGNCSLCGLLLGEKSLLSSSQYGTGLDSGANTEATEHPCMRK